MRLAPLAALLLFAAGPALADDVDYANPDRPGIADGSGVVGKGRFQVEAGFQDALSNAGGVHDRVISAPILARLGLSERFEARVETDGYDWERTGPVYASGWSPVSVGFKYRLQEGAGTRRPSIGVIARLFPASGSGGFGTGHATGDVRLAMDWDLGHGVSLNPNLGVARYEDGQGRLFTAVLFAMTVGYSPSPRLNLFIDTAEQFPEARGGRASAVVDGGAAWMLDKDIQLDVSIGTGFSGLAAPHPFFGAGISKRF